VTDTNGCRATDSITVVVHAHPAPHIAPLGRTVFCEGESVTLDAGDFSSYRWSTGDTTRTIIAAASGVYHVIVWLPL
jgi:Xaa-Pro aminopeptidase